MPRLRWAVEPVMPERVKSAGQMEWERLLAEAVVGDDGLLRLSTDVGAVR